MVPLCSFAELSPPTWITVVFLFGILIKWRVPVIIEAITELTAIFSADAKRAERALRVLAARQTDTEPASEEQTNQVDELDI
jgi:hypothetical protein